MPDRVNINDVNPDAKWVELEPKVDNGSRFPAESFRVTDRPLALRKGTEVKVLGNPGRRSFEVSQLAQPVPGETSNRLNICRNPYNFVELPGSEPWLEKPDGETGSHQGHQSWHPDLHHGFIDVELTARTPIFTPAWQKRDAKPEKLDFYRLKRWENGERVDHFAISGSSFKGAIRSSVEALANDRFGIIVDPCYYQMPIPYRRRAYNDINKPQEQRVGWAERKNGQWSVTAIPYPVVNVTRQQPPQTANLLVQPAKHKARDTTSGGGAGYTIPPQVLAKYQANLKHPHYRRHFEKWQEQFEKTRDASKCNPKQYDPALAGLTFDKVLAGLQMPENDGARVLIFFTVKPGSSEIDSFGRNVNYLWPALHSVADLAGAWFPPEPREKKMGLEQPLGLAERIFGFVSDHGEKSHPFRARVRFEPLWGPAVAQAKPANHVSLGPLTSPESRAKCRPLYLQGNAGKSASYSDAQPKLRGRKFYWKQRYGEGQLWPFHLRGERRPDDPAAAQCPPPIEALPAGTTFTTRIHFENLSAAELGVLLYALVGFSDSHCIHLGKGKPRGLGVCGVKAKVTWFHPKDRYASLTEPPPSKTMTPQEFADARAAFAKWCEERAKPFAELDHIKDFEKLHTWPEADSVRYYPVNWAQYAWVPLPNKNPGDPLAADRPFAMKPAHELEPQPVYR